MFIRNTLKAAALASVCLIPLAAAAQDDTGLGLSGPQPVAQPMPGENVEVPAYDNEVTLGLRGQTSESAVFGRYNGEYNDGVDVIGGLSMRQHPDWKSTNTYYMNLEAKDLSFGAGDRFDLAPNSEVNLRVGNQGTWGLTVDYWADTYVASNNFQTIYNKDGSRVSGAPGTSTTADAPFMQTDVIGLRRDRGTLGLNYMLGNWTFTGGLTHEHKEGTMEESGLENGGSNSSFASFPLPISYDTDNFNLSAAYNTERSQTELGYTFSNFHDNNTAFDYAPYQVKTNCLGGGSCGYTGFYSQAPSNQAHTFSLATGYNLTDTTRLNANAEYGLQLQNEDFVPATGSTLSAADQAKLAGNPTSLSGVIHTVFGSLAVSTVPFPKADLRASYTIDGRYAENGPESIYGDVSDKSTTSAAGALSARIAEQPTWTKQTAAIDLGYRLLDSTKVGVGYSYSQADRSHAVTEETKDNQVTAKARTVFTPSLVGSLQYTYLDRSASDPDWQVFTDLNISDCGTIQANAVKCQQIPFYEAAQTSHTVKGRLTDAIGSAGSASMIGKFDDIHYGDSSFGITHKYDASAGPDFNYRFSPTAQMDVFYTFMRTYRAMTVGANSPPYTSYQSQGTEGTTGDTHTAGVSGSWKVSDKWNLGAGYTFSYGLEAFSQGGYWAQKAGSGVMLNDILPAVTSMDNSVNIHADYAYSPDITVHMGYGFDRLIMNDWALWGAGAPVGENATGLQLTTGEGNPSYAVHTILTSVSFKW